MKKQRPDYGIDAPVIGLRLLLIILAASAIAIFLKRYSNSAAAVASNIILSLVPTGIILIILMVAYIRIGKFQHRNRMMNMLSWNGYEQVLDIGTGHGLLMIGAAKRLMDGKSFGIDIWNPEDMSDNTYDVAMGNAELEGVADKVEIIRADACEIPFSDNSFDIIVSNLCLHNIPDKTKRAAACKEIMRVLKPGGTALISDFMYTKEYTDEFKKMGMEISNFISWIPAPMILRIVKAVKR
ncbi:MAG: class I SAM-dependent methyltransferase [Bacteroidetes bacterium]|nr:class I SAM-dependent methyltransferase [Bacteroidota bacterium]